MEFFARDEAWCAGGRGFASRQWQYNMVNFSSSQMARISHPKMSSSKFLIYFE
jgi:hypothetical protein